jgi:hypothetical protein
MVPAGATVMLLATGDGVPVAVGEPNATGLPSEDGAEACADDPPEPEPPPDDPWPAAADPVAPGE